MSEFVYRFRPIKAIFKETPERPGYNELDEQVIYFASVKELNDPMEGYKDIFWQGDEIVWCNLLKHYLMCLAQKVRDVLMRSPWRHDPNNNYIFQTIDTLPPAFSSMLLDAYDIFFAHEEIKSFPAILATRQSEIRRDELSAYLRCIDAYAHTSILGALEKKGLLPPHMEDFPYPENLVSLSSFFKALEAFDNTNAGVENSLEALGIIINAELLRISLANPGQSKLGKGAIATFPDDYVNQLEELLYSDWYTASFVSNPHNAAMWANYGDGHKGICLKFKTRPNTEGGASMRLYGINGWGGTQNDSGPTYGHTEHTFSQIRYKSEFVKINFFESLGRLARPALKHWYIDSEGRVSSTAKRIFSEDPQWKKEYWDNLQVAMTTKLSDWTHEGEKRLTLSAMMLNLNDPSSRKLKYNFEDLQGIIFGIKTSHEDKIEIMRIIHEKIKETGRNDFEFHQAYYSANTGQISAIKLNLFDIPKQI